MRPKPYAFPGEEAVAGFVGSAILDGERARSGTVACLSLSFEAEVSTWCFVKAFLRGDRARRGAWVEVDCLLTTFESDSLEFLDGEGLEGGRESSGLPPSIAWSTAGFANIEAFDGERARSGVIGASQVSSC